PERLASVPGGPVAPVCQRGASQTPRASRRSAPLGWGAKEKTATPAPQTTEAAKRLAFPLVPASDTIRDANPLLNPLPCNVNPLAHPQTQACYALRQQPTLRPHAGAPHDDVLDSTPRVHRASGQHGGCNGSRLAARRPRAAAADAGDRAP